MNLSPSPLLVLSLVLFARNVADVTAQTPEPTSAPTGEDICNDDKLDCQNGYFSVRDPNNNCDFFSCPNQISTQGAGACTACSNTPTSNMINRGKDCDTATDSIATRCNKDDVWVVWKTCQLSCFFTGNGYDGDNCCEGGTVFPTDAPTEAPTPTPTKAPTHAPTDAATDAPTVASNPTDTPTVTSTDAPTTDEPVNVTEAPTGEPANATQAPGNITESPTGEPANSTTPVNGTLAPVSVPIPENVFTSPTSMPTPNATTGLTPSPTVMAVTPSPTVMAVTPSPTVMAANATTSSPMVSSNSTDTPTQALTEAPTDAPETLNIAKLIDEASSAPANCHFEVAFGIVSAMFFLAVN